MFRRIKNCPDCKSRPELISKKIGFRIKCKHCGLEQFGYFSNKGDAVKAWNNETNPSPLWEEV